MSFAIPLLFMCFCLFQKKWKIQNINLACFKLSLVVFYQLIDVPYGYLFYTSSFVSLVIAANLLTSMEIWKNGSMEV
jgi:K+ transporter